jgi:predicted transposase YdaD
LPRIAKIPLERSRANEFYRVLSEGEEEMREAERLRELEKLGRPANYDLLARDEKLRIDAKLRHLEAT